MQGLLIILLIDYLGVAISSLLHLPLPGSVLGMIILFVLLYTKRLNYNRVKVTGEFLLANMVVFFIAPTVGLVENYHLIKNDLIAFILILVISTIIVMIVTGKVVEYVIKREKKK